VYGLELAGQDDAFAAAEAATAAAGVRVVAPGLATAGSLDRERVRGLGYVHRAVELLGRTDADLAAARALLAAAPLGEPTGTVAVRARDVRGATGVSTAAAERALGGVLTDRGFAVDLEDPDRVLRVLFSGPGADSGGSSDDAGTIPPDAAGSDPRPEDRPGEQVGTADADPVDGVPAGGAVGRTGGAGRASVDRPDGDVCLLGWVVAESRRDFGDRRPTDRPFFQPGSMSPMDARAVANLAGAGPGGRLLDPMCGTGGILVEAGLVGARTVGVDAQTKMVRGARENLATYLTGGDAPTGSTTDPPASAQTDSPPFDVLRGDATRLPFRDDAFDGVAVDAPYGRQSKVARHDLGDLVAGTLAEAARLAPRAVLVADRPWRDPALAAGWTVTGLFDRRVHRSLTRYYHVLVRDDEPVADRDPVG
jgi:tRNA (guanine10-N2)-dimethyltransferase